MSANENGKTIQGLQKSSLLSMTEEKMTKFFYGAYGEDRHTKARLSDLID